MCTIRSCHTYRSSEKCSFWMLFFGYIPPFIAVLLILGNVLPYYFLFLPRLYDSCVAGIGSWFFYAYCHIVMAFTEVLVFGNLYLAIATPPAFVESEPWSRPPVFRGRVHSDNMNEVMQVGRDGKMRYCLQCELYKPDYAYHCRICRRCVYRMDHHCPWINNCVGRNNTKYFLLFVSYIPLGGYHITVTTVFGCLYQLDFHSSSSLMQQMMLVISAFFSFFMATSFFFFAAHFVYMSYQGETTVATFATQKKGEVDVARTLKNERAKYLDDIFGLDRRFWRMICPFKSQRARSFEGVVYTRMEELL